MKNLILIPALISVLSSCSGSGSSSGASGITTSPVVTSPTESQYAKIVDGFYSPVDNRCTDDPYSSNYTKLEVAKALDELIMFQYVFSDSLCNDLLVINSLVYGFHSYTVVGNSDLTTVALLDAQISISNPDVVTSFNAMALFGINTWAVGNAFSILDKVPQPGEPIPYVSNTHRDLTLRVINNSQNIFLNGVEHIKQ